MIYIGIPVHDERHTIGPLLWRTRELLLDLGRDFHVLVLDDASTDRTPDALAPYAQVLPLTSLRNERRTGYGSALERLVREAVGRSEYPRRDALVTLQADFTDPPEAIPEMVRLFEGGADLVTVDPAAGSDGEDGGGEDEGGDGRSAGAQAPGAQRAVRWGARFLARKLPRPPGVADPYGSLRLYRLFILERALGDLAPDRERLLRHEGWAANAELLARVWPHVRRSEEVEATRDHGRRYRESRFRPFSQAWGLRAASRDAALRAYDGRMAAAEERT